jgi:hypothetical protein
MKVLVKAYSLRNKHAPVKTRTFKDFMSDEFGDYVTDLWAQLESGSIDAIIIRRLLRDG